MWILKWFVSPLLFWIMCLSKQISILSSAYVHEWLLASKSIYLWRPAYLHMMITSPGYLFFSMSAYLASLNIVCTYISSLFVVVTILSLNTFQNVFPSIPYVCSYLPNIYSYSKSVSMSAYYLFVYSIFLRAYVHILSWVSSGFLNA